MARNTYEIDERLDSPFNFGQFKRALHYIKPFVPKLIIVFFINITSMFIGLLIPILTMNVIDKSIPEKDIKGLVVTGLIYLALVLMTFVFSYIQAVIVNKVSNRIVYDIREDLFAHLQELPFSYYDNRPHGKILVRVVNYVINVSNFLSNGLINIVIQTLSIIVILFMMFSVNVELSFVILSGVPILVFFIIITKRIQRQARLTYNNKSSNMNAYLAESIDGAKITQSFNRQEYNLGIFTRLNQELQNAWHNLIKIIYIIPSSIEIISNIVLAIVYIAAVLWIGDIKLGVILAMGTYAARFWGPIQNLGNVYNELMNTASYLERIFETMDEPVEIKDKPGAIELPSIKGSVEFRNVTFGYEEGINVLENVSFKVNAGESIALVGPTGAGKTTIVNLLSRFYDINDGEILIDGINISDVTLRSLRRQMGVMLQDTFIFTGTIKDNIRYGRLDAADEEIENAAKAVSADTFIKSKEKGYDTEVSERGQSLSSGQRQLISFARTLLSDPKILILDEATSSIDTETEVLLQKGIKALLQNRTSFIIAHRLSTIKSCDRIFYISNKGIAESGSHEELMAQKGLYYKLYTSQLNELI